MMTEKMIKGIVNSKVDFVGVLTPIMEINTKFFKAKDFNLSGATCGVLKKYGFITIADKEECWYKVDEDTMKRGFINTYRLNITPFDFFEIMLDVNQYKIDKSTYKLNKLAQAHKEETKNLDELLARKDKLLKIFLDIPNNS